MKSIPIKPAPQIPTPVLDACEKLRAKQYKAWLAGGCVRDLIMLRKPRDWDVVTNAPIEVIRELFPRHIEVGVAFGIIKLVPEHTATGPVEIDIAIFRKEEGYSDQRHPDKVEPGDENTDVARRDFTVNALYYDPLEHSVFDYVGGVKDIQSKLLRTVGNPITRFTEDALRILRAARFTAQLQFKIDRDTAAAMKKCAVYLKAISRERIRDEIFRLLATQKPFVGLEAVAQYGLWEGVFGVRKVSLPADFRHLKLSWNPKPIDWICGLAVTGLLGDPLQESKTILDRTTDCLRLSNAERQVFNQTLHIYDDALSKTPKTQPLDWVELGRKDKHLLELIKAFVRRARGPTQEQKDRAMALIDQSLRWASRPGSEKSWPSSQQLMSEGIKAGPQLGKELRQRQWETFWATKPS